MGSSLVRAPFSPALLESAAYQVSHFPVNQTNLGAWINGDNRTRVAPNLAPVRSAVAPMS